MACTMLSQLQAMPCHGYQECSVIIHNVQVWGRIAGLEEDSNKISFEKFLTNMRQFQYDSTDEKLRSMNTTIASPW